MTGAGKWRALAARRQRGIAAVELAMALPPLVLMMAILMLAAQLFWYYTVLQYAVSDAARYMSSLPRLEMTTPAKAAAAADIARDMVINAAAAASLRPLPVKALVTVLCGDTNGDDVNCGNLVPPLHVRVQTNITLDVNMIGEVVLTARVVLPYAN